MLGKKNARSPLNEVLWESRCGRELYTVDGSDFTCYPSTLSKSQQKVKVNFLGSSDTDLQRKEMFGLSNK